MENRYNIPQILVDILHLKGRIYPGMFIFNKRGQATGGDFSDMPLAPEQALYTDKGTPLRKKDAATGLYYFMPVTLAGMEIPLAVISAVNKKTIIQTPLIGRAGSVKELVSVNDYEISLGGVLIGEDYPTDKIEAINAIYRRSEAVEISSALTDILLGEDDKVVITEIEWPAVGAVENMQPFTMRLLSDRPFQLIFNIHD